MTLVLHCGVNVVVAVINSSERARYRRSVTFGHVGLRRIAVIDLKPPGHQLPGEAYTIFPNVADRRLLQ